MTVSEVGVYYRRMNMEDYKQQKSAEDLEKVVTMGVLLEYTHDLLLPAIDDMFQKSEERMDKKLGKLEYNLKVYIDNKMADYSSDIFKRLEAKYQKEKHFHEKVVELFRKHNIGSPEDIAFLDGLAQ